MAQRTEHLSKIDERATLLAWHQEDDVQAIRLMGEELLVVDGKVIPLHPVNDAHATQAIINYCSAGKRGKIAHRKYWAGLALLAESDVA